MSAHTPGPWTAEDVLGEGPIDVCGPEAPDQGPPYLLATAFADLGCEGFLPLETAIANARLIAAAPELADLLREAVAKGMPYGPSWFEWTERVKATLAKAERR